MSLLRTIRDFLSRLFCKRKGDDYELVWEDSGSLSDERWNVCLKGPSSWNRQAGLQPKKMIVGRQPIVRLECVKADNEDGWQTAAVITKEAYPDGKLECVAKFNSGKSTWPAIWMSHPNGAKNNYETYFEIDLSEYYEKRDVTESTYHYPQSMRGEAKSKNVRTKIKKDEWNKFTCIWNDESIKVLINDVLAFELKNNGDPTYYPVDENLRTFNIILSMQYANRWLSEPDLSELPLWMDIKSIKYWRKAK